MDAELPNQIGSRWRAPASRRILLAEGLGCSLLFASGAIHLDLYLTGYRLIPRIGVLFLLQAASAFLLALTVLVLASLGHRVRLRGIEAETLGAGAAALFAVATLGGYLLSLWVGLFGFREVRTTAGMTAAAIEIMAFVALSWAVAMRSRRRLTRRLPLPLAAVAVLLLAVAEITATGGGSYAPTTPKEASGGSQVVVIIKNFAFHPDDPSARPGERIVVKNEDPVAHTFSTAPGAPAAEAFSTGAIPPGGSRTVTAPSVPGTYHVICLIHQFMTATLTVTSSGSATGSGTSRTGEIAVSSAIGRDDADVYGVSTRKVDEPVKALGAACGISRCEGCGSGAALRYLGATRSRPSGSAGSRASSHTSPATRPT
jgi:plastocyanin